MGNCWSKCFEEDKADEETVVDPKTPLLGSTIRSIADTSQSSKSFNSIFNARPPGAVLHSGVTPGGPEDAVREESPQLPPKQPSSKRNFPSPPTGRYSTPPRGPSLVNLSRASTEFYSPPLPPSKAYPVTPPLPPKSDLPAQSLVFTPYAPEQNQASAEAPQYTQPPPRAQSTYDIPPQQLDDEFQPAQRPQTMPPQHTTVEESPRALPRRPSILTPEMIQNSRQSNDSNDSNSTTKPEDNVAPQPATQTTTQPLQSQTTTQPSQSQSTNTLERQLTTSQSESSLPTTQSTVPAERQLTTSQSTGQLPTQTTTHPKLPTNKSEQHLETEKEKENDIFLRDKERQSLTASDLYKILTNKTDDHTPQEKISQIIQNLLDLCKEIGELIAWSEAVVDFSAETTMKKRIDFLTVKASKNTAQLCDVVETLTSLKKNDTKRGKWEEELRTTTRNASSKIEQLVIECRNANADQRKTNVKAYIENLEKLLNKISSQVTQLVEMVLAQGQVMQAAQSIIDATNRHAAVSGVDPVMRAAKVAVSVVQRVVDSLANELVISGTSDLKRSITKTFHISSPTDSKEHDPAMFFSNALHVCAIQLFEAVDQIAQSQYDPGVQLELWNKAKAVRGAGFLLQLSITEKNRELSDRCLSLSAASKVFSSSVVDLIEASVSAVTKNVAPQRPEEGTSSTKTDAESENVWEEEERLGPERIGEIILLENPDFAISLSPTMSPVASPSLRPKKDLHLDEKEKVNEKEKDNAKEKEKEQELEKDKEKEIEAENKESEANEETKEKEIQESEPEQASKESEPVSEEKEESEKEIETTAAEDINEEVKAENEPEPASIEPEPAAEEAEPAEKESEPEPEPAKEPEPAIAEPEPAQEKELEAVAEEYSVPTEKESVESEAPTETPAELALSPTPAPVAIPVAPSTPSSLTAPTSPSLPPTSPSLPHASPLPHTPTSAASPDPIGASRKLKAATLNGLLLYLIFDRIDIQYMETIALTYRSFVDSKPFFLKLTELYNVPESKGSQEVIVIQSRVSTFLKKWISLQVQDFSDDLIKTIAKWTEENLQKDNHSKGVAKQILEILTLRNDLRTAVRKSFADAMESKMYKELTPIELVLGMDPQDIALQLTLIDHSLFCAIRPHELLFQSWNKPHLRHRAPNVLSMISRTNNIALWVASSILWHPKLSDRANVMTKLIFVAEHLRKLKNFNTMFAVLSGLQLSSVNRLKYTKEKVPKKQLQTFDSLVELMSATKSFKVYREALANEIPPCIPYLGLCLTDLTFIEEGNPDYIQPTDKEAKQQGKLINFKKREKLFKVISDIQQYQNWKYSEKQEREKISILEELPRNEEEQLYGMSLLREPRNASKEQIV